MVPFLFQNLKRTFKEKNIFHSNPSFVSHVLSLLVGLFFFLVIIDQDIKYFMIIQNCILDYLIFKFKKNIDDYVIIMANNYLDTPMMGLCTPYNNFVFLYSRTTNFMQHQLNFMSINSPLLTACLHFEHYWFIVGCSTSI